MTEPKHTPEPSPMAMRAARRIVEALCRPADRPALGNEPVAYLELAGIIDIETAALRKACKGLRRDDDDEDDDGCWCDVAEDNPMYGGEHTGECDAMRAAVADAEPKEKP